MGRPTHSVLHHFLIYQLELVMHLQGQLPQLGNLPNQQTKESDVATVKAAHQENHI
jgi:hypothetical protein